MARKRTGLRNKFRSGRSSYAQRRRVNGADYYGKPVAGKIEDIIAGYVIRYSVGVQHS